MNSSGDFDSHFDSAQWTAQSPVLRWLSGVEATVVEVGVEATIAIKENKRYTLMKNILFITTTNLSTNPRLLKELKLAFKAGFDVKLIAFQLGGWSDITEKEHLNELKGINAHYLPAQKKTFLNWAITNFIWKLCMQLSRISRKSLLINSIAHNKRTWQILQKLNKISSQFDLVIAHNLGALYPAWHFSKKHQIPFTFDIEDYHPGEKCSPSEKTRREFLMQKLLPKATYLTYASPLIGKYALELLNSSQIPDNILINNCFSQNEFEFIENNSGKIQLVWFSQNINAGRGLELLLPVLYKFKYQVQINLIGNLYNQFYHVFLHQYADILNIIKPMPQAELHKCICSFDIGLAIEQKASDFNRDICLTNKIFAYAQSGLYILATDTSAQKQFINEHPSLGRMAGQSETEMEEAVASIIQNIESIRAAKKTRFENAKTLRWENESGKLTEIWEKLMG
jgi:hypothetical protein